MTEPRHHWSFLWLDRRRRLEADLDDALEMTFPASDPVAIGSDAASRALNRPQTRPSSTAG